MTTISNERLAEMVGAGVPCVPAAPGEIAAVVQELRALRASSWVEVDDGWFALKGDARLGRCATDGCGGQPAFRLEVGGIGSDYCSGCAESIRAYRRLSSPPPMIMRMVAAGNALVGWMDMTNPGAQTDWAKWRDTSAEALKMATAALSQNKGEA